MLSSSFLVIQEPQLRKFPLLQQFYFLPINSETAGARLTKTSEQSFASFEHKFLLYLDDN